jgi:monovalent cation:proton antiporter-2 (CPA2) family protein
MSFLSQAAVFLGAAVVAVPLSRRLGLGSVLGYLVAGAAIGPWGLGLVSDVDNILHFAEFGVVLLLFVIGLELQPTRLWTMRRPVFGLGGAQVALTAAVVGGTALFLGTDWRAAVAIGLGLSLSSTAFALQVLAEKGQLTTRHGRTAFSILLFQDLAAIPILALLPVLNPGGQEPAGVTDTLISIGTVAGIVGAVILVCHFALRHLLRLVARARIREIFTACALFTVTGMALLMESLGLSMALGAFLAGVLLADSEFRHALEADIDPFKGLLLGLFFIAVGMSVNFGLLATGPGVVLGLTLGLTALKFAVLYGLGIASGHDKRAALNLAVSISQGGEFAFVIFTIAVGSGVMPRETADLLILVVTLSMAVTPFLFILSERILAPRMTALSDRPFDVQPPEEDQVIIAGFGRYGQIVGRILQARKIGFTALEASMDQVDFVARYGNKVYYGDASRLDLLRAAKADKAVVFVIAVDDVDASVRIAETVVENFPNLRVLARARNRQHAYRLMDAGVTEIWRETLHSSLGTAESVLTALGLSQRDAERTVETFREHDERLLGLQYTQQKNDACMVALSREWATELEQIFEQDARDDSRGDD